MNYSTEDNSICLERLNIVVPRSFFDLDETLKEKYITQNKIYNEIKFKVDNDVNIMRNTQNDLLDILKKNYIKNNGKKMNDEEKFYYDDENESEGRVLDYMIELQKKIEKTSINPIGVCETALLYVKKAEELNYVEDLRKMKYFGFTFNTGFYAEPYLGAILNGKTLFELASNHEDYLEYHKKSDHILDSIQKWMNTNDEIQQWLKDEEFTSHFKMTKDQWIYCIAFYHVKMSIESKDNIYFPIDGNSDGPIKSFGYHMITWDDLKESIESLKKVFKEKEESDKILNKILKPILKDSSQETNILYSNQYLHILSKYYMEHPRSLKKNIIFHPPVHEEETSSFSINYYDISDSDIKHMINHLKNIEKKYNFELVDTIKKWAIDKKCISDTPLSEKAWTKIIKRYHKKNNMKMDKDILYYVPRKHKKENSLDYRIIDYDDLTKDSTDYAFLDMLYDSESDTNVNSDSEDDDIF